ncbi:hypothetical protein QE152_g35326 [Popillia japonica]|uniref:Uncharacterized protein n=1 Tax=Popillia japonica TaxID=7064 RepID=A0AAW1IFL3_POPJA
MVQLGGSRSYAVSKELHIRNVKNAHNDRQGRTSVIPEVYKRTLSGENFLQFDSGHLEWESRMLSTKRSLNALDRSEHWNMDGTFKTIPQIFAQLYTTHGLKDNPFISLVYV